MTYGIRERANNPAQEETSDGDKMQLKFPCLLDPTLQDMTNGDTEIRSSTGQMCSTKGVVAVSTSQTILHPAGQGTAPDKVRSTWGKNKK